MHYCPPGASILNIERDVMRNPTCYRPPIPNSFLCNNPPNITSCRHASMEVSGWQGNVFWPALARKQLAKFKANLSQ